MPDGELDDVETQTTTVQNPATADDAAADDASKPEAAASSSGGGYPGHYVNEFIAGLMYQLGLFIAAKPILVTI
jgi:hypothetical protein